MKYYPSNTSSVEIWTVLLNGMLLCAAYVALPQKKSLITHSKMEKNPISISIKRVLKPNSGVNKHETSTTKHI